MAENKLTDKEKEEKIKELKIELLKQAGKRKAVKKEIARLLTLTTKQIRRNPEKNKK